MNAIIFLAALAMLTMVNAAPVQEEQKNLQGLLDVLANKRNTEADSNGIVKQQQQDGDDDGTMQELQGFLKSLQQDGDKSANAQFLHHFVKGAIGAIRHFWATQQQDGDKSANAQFLHHFVKGAIGAIRHFWATQQQNGDDDGTMQELQGLLKSLQRDGDANAQRFNWHGFFRGVLGAAHRNYANQQQDDDGNQAEAQFFSKLARSLANQQNDDEDVANIQLLGFLAKRGLNAFKKNNMY